METFYRNQIYVPSTTCVVMHIIKFTYGLYHRKLKKVKRKY